MKIKKERKPRTKSQDLGFDGSHMFNYPNHNESPAARKINKRWDAGVCIGCGQKECRCKSSHI